MFSWILLGQCLLAAAAVGLVMYCLIVLYPWWTEQPYGSAYVEMNQHTPDLIEVPSPDQAALRTWIVRFKGHVILRYRGELLYRGDMELMPPAMLERMKAIEKEIDEQNAQDKAELHAKSCASNQA